MARSCSGPSTSRLRRWSSCRCAVPSLASSAAAVSRSCCERLELAAPLGDGLAGRGDVDQVVTAGCWRESQARTRAGSVSRSRPSWPAAAWWRLPGSGEPGLRLVVGVLAGGARACSAARRHRSWPFPAALRRGSGGLGQSLLRPSGPGRAVGGLTWLSSSSWSSSSGLATAVCRRLCSLVPNSAPPRRPFPSSAAGAGQVPHCRDCVLAGLLQPVWACLGRRPAASDVCRCAAAASACAFASSSRRLALPSCAFFDGFVRGVQGVRVRGGRRAGSHPAAAAGRSGTARQPPVLLRLRARRRGCGFRRAAPRRTAAVAAASSAAPARGRSFAEGRCSCCEGLVFFPLCLAGLRGCSQCRAGGVLQSSRGLAVLLAARFAVIARFGPARWRGRADR